MLSVLARCNLAPSVVSLALQSEHSRSEANQPLTESRTCHPFCKQINDESVGAAILTNAFLRAPSESFCANRFTQKPYLFALSPLFSSKTLFKLLL